MTQHNPTLKLSNKTVLQAWVQYILYW